ncbi:MAG: hypothetical protein WBP61_06320 [Nocardioides sp.]
MFSAPRRLVPTVVIAVLASLLLAAPSAAADTGSISGTVTARPAGGSPIAYAGASVVLDRFRGDSEFTDPGVAVADSDADGHFTVSGLADGRYQIRTYPTEYGELGQYGYEYYDNRNGPYGAAVVEVSDGAAVTLESTIELQPIGRVKGRVVDEAGQPVQGSVLVAPERAGGASVRTDEDGNYDTLTGEWTGNLIPGEYVASFNPGSSEIGDTVYYLVDQPATVTAGGTTTVNFTLVERPSVDFTVRGSDGEPAAFAPVSFWMRDGNGPWRTPQYGPITTDEQGRFRILDNVDAYRLRFSPEAGSADVPEYWHDAYAFEDAEVVSFTGSDPLRRSYDVQLGAAPTIKAGTPSISGTAAVGQTLTLDPGTWAPSGVATTVEWFAGDDQIGTGTELTLRPAHVDQWIWARVTGSKAGEQSVDVAADWLGPVAPGELSVRSGVPSISGTPRAGRTLTAAPGDWGPAGVQLAYQWLADDAPVAGANSPTYDVTNKVAGKRISVRVTGSFDVADDVSATSGPTAKVVGKLSTRRATIIGKTRKGSKLRAKVASWGPGSVQLGYAWFRGNRPIKRADDRAYRLVKADVGKRLKVVVTGRKSGFQTVSTASARTAKIRK